MADFGGLLSCPTNKATGRKHPKSRRERRNSVLKQMLLIGAAAVSFPVLAQTIAPTGEEPAPTSQTPPAPTDTPAPAPDEKFADDANPTDDTAPTEEAMPTDSPPAAEPNPPANQFAPEPEPTPEPDPE
jgi:type IV secretory pathway VirB10-like protein